MNSGQILSDTYFAVDPVHTVSHAIDRMAEYRLLHLPVVKDHVFLGMVSYESLTGVKDRNVEIAVADLSYMQVHIYDYQHIYDALLFFQLYRLDILPVLDRQYTYLGAITQYELINAMGSSMSIQEPGAVIVLEMSKRDNALSQIARIVESNDAQVLNSAVRVFPDSSQMEVAIKVNKVDISPIVATFLRFDYVVKATFNDDNSNDSSRDRYEQLMNYINM